MSIVLFTIGNDNATYGVNQIDNIYIYDDKKLIQFQNQVF